MLLSGGDDTVGAVHSSSWPGLAVPVDDSHPAPVGDVSHQAESLRGRAAVQPALSQVPAGRDEENIVQAWHSSTAGPALLTGCSVLTWSVSPLTLSSHLASGKVDVSADQLYLSRPVLSLQQPQTARVPVVVDGPRGARPEAGEAGAALQYKTQLLNNNNTGHSHSPPRSNPAQLRTRGTVCL